MSEFGPSPQSEEEKEEQGVSLAKEIADLRSGAQTDEDYENILRKTKVLKELFGISSWDTASDETKLSGEIAEQIERAKEILGSDVFGPDAVKEAFGTAIELGSIPSIPFSVNELERAKELGQMLILRAGKLSDGSKLNMKKIGEILGGKVKDEGKVFYNPDWYKDEKFFTDDAVETGWALVSKGLVSDSVNKNYFEQTGLLIDQLNQSFNGAENLPEEYVEAVKEYAFAMDEIAELIDTDWQKAAEKLEGLEINQLLRQSPSEALYDLILYFQNTGKRLLGDKYTWTKRRNSDGRLVYVGYFESAGVSVGRYRPGYSRGDLGVSFSRSR
ncbi:MAG: hypothetical protein WCV58_00445 [Patescibacteria group bacterium]